MGMTNRLVRTILLLCVLGFTACTWPFAQPRAKVGSCCTTLPPNPSDEAAIRAVLAAEGDLVVKQAITPLMLLWAEGGFVANAKNTPANQEDDQFWLDKDAIRHRYVRTVFPGAPQAATPADLTITLEGERAIVYRHHPHWRRSFASR